MKLAQSRLTSQGQVSVPAEVRRRLGLSPGSVLEWEADGEQIVVRRSQKHASTDVHSLLFPEGAVPTKSLQDLKDGLLLEVARRHARR